MPSATNRPAVAPVRAWTASVISCIQPLIMCCAPGPTIGDRLAREAGRLAAAPLLAPPVRAEEKAEADSKCQRRIGPVLDRLVDRVGEVARHVAHCAGGFLALGLGVRHDAVSAGLGPPPRGVAFAGENVANLLGKPAEIVAQRLQILLEVAGCGGGGFADLANAFASFLRRVSHGLRGRGGRVHGCTPCGKELELPE